MPEYELSFGPSETFADKETRTIKGLLVPNDGVANRGGYSLKIAPNGITMRDRVPVLMGHDMTRPVGMMTAHEWNADGLEVTLSVAKTAAGDEALELASMGALALSAGFDPIKTSTSKDGSTITVLSGDGKECSLVSIPALSGALISSVALAETTESTTEEKGSAMTEDNGAVLAALNDINANLTKLNDRPAVVPTPVAHVTEAPLYKLDGPGGQHNFSQDFIAAVDGDVTAKARMNAYVAERFAVTSSDVGPGQAPKFDPSLGYGADRPYYNDLLSIATVHGLTDNASFSYPIRNAVTGTLISNHVEGTEPALSGGVTWSTQNVTVGALDGKVAFTRETLDRLGSMPQDFVWNEMVKASERQASARLIAMLDGLTLPAGQIKAVTGTDATLLKNMDTVRLGLLEPQRFGAAVLTPAHFAAVFLAQDSTGRRLASAINPQNATATASLTQVTAGGITYVQGRDSAGQAIGNGYLLDQSAVHVFLGQPRRFNIDIAVSNVYLGFMQYVAQCATDLSGVVRLTYSAS